MVRGKLRGRYILREELERRGGANEPLAPPVNAHFMDLLKVRRFAAPIMSLYDLINFSISLLA